VILSMAWLTREDARSYSRSPKEPDMDTLSYWLARLEPLIRAETEGEIICVFANRSGTEDDAVYAGTSAVLGVHAGEVKVYGILGRGERELLVVDTDKRPQAKLVSEPCSAASDVPQSPLMGNPPDSRTNSTVSDKSSLSTGTINSAITIPDPFDPHYPLDEANTPLSPVNSKYENSFFAPPPTGPVDGDTLRDALLSSISHNTGFPPTNPEASFRRPASPKSRNASRTRQPEVQQPALIAHDLAYEEQSTQIAVGETSPQLPQSGSSSPGQLQSTSTRHYFGPRSSHIHPRPRSTAW
jgi:protein N-terminal amidase